MTRTMTVVGVTLEKTLEKEEEREQQQQPRP